MFHPIYSNYLFILWYVVTTRPPLVIYIMRYMFQEFYQNRFKITLLILINMKNGVTFYRSDADEKHRHWMALTKSEFKCPLSENTAIITEGKHFSVTPDHVSQQHGDGCTKLVLWRVRRRLFKCVTTFIYLTYRCGVIPLCTVNTASPLHCDKLFYHRLVDTSVSRGL